MKTTLIYHSADYDGLFCREIARKFLPDAELIGWNFGDPPVSIARITGGMIYVLDLPLDAPFGMVKPAFDENSKDIVWIDHHKTAIETHDPKTQGYRIDGVAACRLAWQWFYQNASLPHNAAAATHPTLPQKSDYLERRVTEPLAVRLAGEYDIWDHRGDGDLEFQFGLRVESPDIKWETLLGDGKTELLPSGRITCSQGADVYVRELIDKGKAAMRYAANVDAGMTKHQAFLLHWEGLKFLTLNTGRFNSQTFAALDVPVTGHDALLGFNWNGKRWTVSLYHATHRTDLDLSEIAKKYGGGGHRGACGFTASSLPFVL